MYYALHFSDLYEPSECLLNDDVFAVWRAGTGLHEDTANIICYNKRC